ncbi:RICIN domain-containing protein [Catenulispora subtropica]|uniref:RICIN domain-containing protein n=1 Tax=Catenulispora subtropica TaxID=450798 RepID=UPI0031E3A971
MRHRLLPAALAAAALVSSLSAFGRAAATTNPPPNPIVTISATDTTAQILAKAAVVTPNSQQLAWQREELTGFIHFGPNTYTGSEVGSGTESPNLIQPTSLNTDQWAADFKNAGFKKVILVAKHHDGMLMFPSAYSSYGIAASSWDGGQGDLVKSFTDSAHRLGLKVGIYLSPADLHEAQSGGRYGDGSTAKSVTIPSDTSETVDGKTFTFTSDDYNTYYENTLYELLTRYGTVDELWFDGYNPTNRPQPYDYRDWFQMVRALQPTAAMFGGPDLRWVGNENGVARASEWSVVPQTGTADPDGTRSPTFGDTATDVASDARMTTQSSYLAWSPAECDARLEPTWFWHPNQAPKTLDQLTAMYYSSVGQNCQLLLDVPPDQSGRFDAADEAALAGFGRQIASTFATDLARGATVANDTGTTSTAGDDPGNVVDGDDATAWQPTGTTGSLVLDLGAAKTFDVVALQEDIQIGQRVETFAVDIWNGSTWQQAASATTVGYKRLLQLSNPVTASKVRLRITGSRSLPPAIATVGLFYDGRVFDLAAGTPATSSSTVYGGVPTRAVDGDTDGTWADGSVSHTDSQANAWWQTDLGSSRRLGSVAIWNRTDCCSDRLSDYWVFISDQPFDTALTPAQQAARPGVWSNHQSTKAGTPTRLNVNATGRYIMVQLSGTNYLSLAEVQAFAPSTDFSLSASQPMASVPAGTGTTSTVATSVVLGSPDAVVLSASGLPAGATATFSPATVTAGGSSTLTIHTAPDTPVGDSLVTITGTGSQDTHTAQLTLSVTAPLLTSGGVYAIGRAGTGQVIDDPGSSTVPSTQLIVYVGNGGTNQHWIATATADGGYTIKSSASGLCADVTGSSTSPGAAIIQYGCTGNANQRWYPVATPGGYGLQSASSGLYVGPGGTVNGLTVLTQQSTPTAWSFARVG